MKEQVASMKTKGSARVKNIATQMKKKSRDV